MRRYRAAADEKEDEQPNRLGGQRPTEAWSASSGQRAGRRCCGILIHRNSLAELASKDAGSNLQVHLEKCPDQSVSCSSLARFSQPYRDSPRYLLGSASATTE